MPPEPEVEIIKHFNLAFSPVCRSGLVPVLDPLHSYVASISGKPIRWSMIVIRIYPLSTSWWEDDLNKHSNGGEKHPLKS